MSSVQVCPFCQLHNACGIDKIEQCWCVVQTIPAAMISLLPAEHQNTHCICASCVQAFNANPDTFSLVSHSK